MTWQIKPYLYLFAVFSADATKLAISLYWYYEYFISHVHYLQIHAVSSKMIMDDAAKPTRIMYILFCADVCSKALCIDVRHTVLVKHNKLCIYLLLVYC